MVENQRETVFRHRFAVLPYELYVDQDSQLWLDELASRVQRTLDVFSSPCVSFAVAKVVWSEIEYRSHSIAKPFFGGTYGLHKALQTPNCADVATLNMQLLDRFNYPAQLEFSYLLPSGKPTHTIVVTHQNEVLDPLLSRGGTSRFPYGFFTQRADYDRYVGKASSFREKVKTC